MIAGIDFSTRAIDVVLLDESTNAATWHRAGLDGHDGFERARDVHRAMLDTFGSGLWDDVLGCGIEEPMMRGGGMSSAYSLYRVQGAVLAQLPARLLVQPLKPSVWRKEVGLPGNATKQQVSDWTNHKRLGHALDGVLMQPFTRKLQAVRTTPDWPQDACDAYCIALATRNLLQHTTT